MFRADGTNFLETYVEGPRTADVALHAAQDLFDRGARDILGELEGGAGPGGAGRDT